MLGLKWKEGNYDSACDHAVRPKKLAIIVDPVTQDRIFVFTFPLWGTLAMRFSPEAIQQIRQRLMQIEAGTLH